MSRGKNNQEMIPESPDLLDNIDPLDVIYLEELQEEPMPNLRATSNKPIAELHIRYQTKEWLQNEGFDLIDSSDNSLISTNNNISLFEDEEFDDEMIVTSEQIEEITDDADDTDDNSKKKFLPKIDEYSPSIIINNNDEVMNKICNFEDDEEEEAGSENFKEKDKVASASPNYRVIRENMNEQVENKLLDESVERNSLEVESRIIEIITGGNIIRNVELAANEGLNERIKEISINDREEGDGGDDLMRNEFDRQFIDLTESPKEIIEISDDDDDDVILVETHRSFLPTSVNKKKYRKKIKYYSDSSIDWNNDDSNYYSDSSSEDEFISISKKRLRT
ncbi:hypothetical protein C1645_750074 [Glomus cerebriforme]|uniref:Uncharacterized protein n=1 Tax=Glomus cerebriforme TaxID=658196 RepID=A0A397TTY2_9GLOM|nr:hypothetical protein C1645_750074 [Glomus cerebriforme]